MFIGRGIDVNGDGGADVFVGRRVGPIGFTGCASAILLLVVLPALIVGALLAYSDWKNERGRFVTKDKVEEGIRTTQFRAVCGHKLLQFGDHLILRDVEAAKLLADFEGHINFDIDTFKVYGDEVIEALATKHQGVIKLWQSKDFQSWGNEWVVALLHSGVPLHVSLGTLHPDLAKEIARHKGPMRITATIPGDQKAVVLNQLRRHRAAIRVETEYLNETEYAHGELPPCLRVK